MQNSPFRVLYRQFLFRMVDLEILSAHALGDSNKLLGQFASLLIFLSVLSSFSAFIFAGLTLTPPAGLLLTMASEHFLISTTMLVVGLFAVLCWDSTFPDRRDVMVLAPLPIRPRTMFLGKIAAVATALVFTVALLHGPAGLFWPLAFALHAARQGNPSVLEMLRWIAAFWFTMLAAGAFIYTALLLAQGIAAQLLPRRLFLRASGLLQLTAFSLSVIVFFLQPAVGSLQFLSSPGSHPLIPWLPSYWFLGLFHELNGSAFPPFAPLARRAWMGLAITVGGTALAYALSYARTLRKIVEEPDIAPGSRGSIWLPPFGNRLQTAIGHFAIRALARSRQHRMILTFYWGVGFALIVFLLKSPSVQRSLPRGGDPWREASIPFLAASIVMMTFSIVGTRVVFALPLDLRANWIFRVTGISSGPKTLAASRRALLLLSAAPVWLASAAFCLRLWPWQQAVGHLAVLGLLSVCLADACLHGFRKIPFTCSYLPGKSQVHMVFLGALIPVYVVQVAVKQERESLQEPRSIVAMLVLLALVAGVIRWTTAALARPEDSEGGELQFEEAPAPTVLELGLHRDGVIPMSRPPDPRD